jgi:integrase
VILRERSNTGGTISWQLDYGVVDGKRKRVSFSDRVEAERAMAAARDSQKRLGALGLTASPLEMAEFLALKERLRESGTSILEAVEFFMQRGLKVARPKLLPEVITDFIWSRRELGRDGRTIQTYTHVLGSLARAWPLRLAHDLTREEVQTWLRGTGWSASTQNKALGHVRGLFQWAIAQKHAGDDPCRDMERLTVTTEEVEGLSLAECERLLATALRVPRVMPYLVLGLFRGMRRAELERLRFEELDLDEGTAIAAAKKVKTRQRRVIEITPQMMVWIHAAGWTPEMMQSGPVAPGNLKEVWPRFWKLAGLTAWPHNALRHTFASMHYAMHQDETLLQSILGQRSKDVLHSNYRALKTKREAEAFWSMMPPMGWEPPQWSVREPVFGPQISQIGA